MGHLSFQPLVHNSASKDIRPRLVMFCRGELLFDFTHIFRVTAPAQGRFYDCQSSNEGAQKTADKSVTKKE